VKRVLRARFASQNEHKLEELRAALPEWQIELLDVDDFPEEKGLTYYENALAKARFGRALSDSDVWVLGEDSGLEVDALGGRPGIHSARWAANPVERLLEEGSIARSLRGTEGFGYDPIFVPEGESLTVAELGNAWKARNAHRARAAAALLRAL
jgi:XTP/dITP diphosphohydrolase